MKAPLLILCATQCLGLALAIEPGVARKMQDFDRLAITRSIGNTLPNKAACYFWESVKPPPTNEGCKITVKPTERSMVRLVTDGVVQAVGSFLPSPISGVFSAIPQIVNFLMRMEGHTLPVQTFDIWNCIKGDVERVVDQKISDQAFSQATERLKGIHEHLTFYSCLFTKWQKKDQNVPCTFLSRRDGEGDIKTDLDKEALNFHAQLLSQIPQFGSIAQQELLLPYYSLVTTIYFSLVNDIQRYGAEWGMAEATINAVREKAKEGLKTYLGHVRDVTKKATIDGCALQKGDGCSKMFSTIASSLAIAGTWPVYAFPDVFGKHGVESHPTHHLTSEGPTQTMLEPSDVIKAAMFSPSEFYRQAICTDTDDIVFGQSTNIYWDATTFKAVRYDQGGWILGHTDWKYGKDESCRSSYDFAYAPSCGKCSTATASNGDKQSKLIEGKHLGVLQHQFKYFSNEKRHCGYPGIYNTPLLKPQSGYKNNFLVPSGYQLYNMHILGPAPQGHGMDIADVVTRTGSGVVLEYAPLPKSFDSLATIGTTHIIPGLYREMKWSPQVDKASAGEVEFIFGGHAAFAIGAGGDDTTFYQIATPSGTVLPRFKIGVYIKSDSGSFTARIIHEKDEATLELTKQNISVEGVSGTYHLYLSEVMEVPAIKQVAIVGPKALLGAIILANDIAPKTN